MHPARLANAAILSLSLGAATTAAGADAPERITGTLPLTGYDAGPILEALDRNDGQVVSLDLSLDASQTTEVQRLFTELNNPENQIAFLDGHIYNTAIPLAPDSACEEAVTLQLATGRDGLPDACLSKTFITFESDDTLQEPRLGGTGVIAYTLSGAHSLRIDRGAGMTFYTLTPTTP